MSAQMQSIESPAVRPIRETLARIGFGITGAVAVVTALLSAAAVWLVLTRPLAVADALEGRRVTEVVQAMVGLMVSMLRDLASYL